MPAPLEPFGLAQASAIPDGRRSHSEERPGRMCENREAEFSNDSRPSRKWEGAEPSHSGVLESFGAGSRLGRLLPWGYRQHWSVR
jgi:hypothetical protein